MRARELALVPTCALLGRSNHKVLRALDTLDIVVQLKMYSLYRAWFGGPEPTSFPRLETLSSPPDTLVRVGNEGEYHFVAHRVILTAHSGYIKALLGTPGTATAERSSTTTKTDGTPQSIITSITIPSTIGGETFAPLLNYMYTGRLEVTLDNIYTVLLATHLLHMPGALEQCRAALLRLRAAPPVPIPVSATCTTQTSNSSSSGNILRPVPSRLLAPSFCWPPQTSTSTSHLYPPRHLELSHLPALQIPSAISVLPSTSLVHKTNLSYTAKESSVSPESSGSRPAAGVKSGTLSPELVVASSSSSQHSDEHQPRSLEQRSISTVSSERVVSEGESTKRRSQQQQSNNSRPKHHRSSLRGSQLEGSVIKTGIVAPGVVFDVACCDGPVRFHRVLNENYAPMNPQQRLLVSQCNGRSCSEPDEATSPGENEENEQQSESNATDSSSNPSYTCSYCRHTFKSQYCYRKHARRHLLPTGGNTNGQTLSQPSTQHLQSQHRQTNSQQTMMGPVNKKREVRLLDLNVQYYPCKICGSKFPSYYFVHKHRKLCHADEPRTPTSDERKQHQPGTSDTTTTTQQPA